MSSLTVVGIGMSAGGLRALKDLLSSKPDLAGACVLIAAHLDNGGKSLAIEALNRIVPVPVTLLRSGTILNEAAVYLLPPQTMLSFKAGKVVLTPTASTAQKLAVVDQLFFAIGKQYGESAVGIVLSGEAADGARGIRRLNDYGGLAIAQDPSLAEHKSMPEAAIASGAIDHVLDPAKIWAEVTTHIHFTAVNETDPKKKALKEEITAAITSICEILQQRTRHDFKHYKTSTLLRRIQRRMQVLHHKTVQRYLDHLNASPEECEALFNELLINVTSFFRDKEAFEALKEEVLKPLLSKHTGQQKIRIWVPGCSTGEEAYSIAMMAKEIASAMEQAPEIQVIATDIDDNALNVGRRGSYPATIAEHVSPARLNRFFSKRAGKYHVAKELRETCLFSIHNLINDPPFSQIDLISCRNLLIYLGPHLQKKLFPIFHYSLRTNGYLFLGSSETLSTHKELFKSVNSKLRIAQRKATAIKMPSISTSVQTYLSHFQESEQVTEADLSLIGQRIALDEMPLRYAIVNDEGNVLSASSGLGKYVEIPEGVFQNNIVKLVTPGLRAALRSAFAVAKKHKRKVTNDTCSINWKGALERTGVIVQPMPQLGDVSELYWVAFQSMGIITKREASVNQPPSEDSLEIIDQLERELGAVRRELDKSVQDLEASNEELKSSNEELLSMNEELQSANEELETSKEEVQNSNDALQRANTDLENLLASTRIATLFLDDEYNIRGFTPAIDSIYNIQPGDIGRNLFDFSTRAKKLPAYPKVSEIGFDQLQDDEVHLHDGRIFSRRILPYRTAENIHEGLVVTFIEITELRRSEQRFSTLANLVPVINWTADANGDVAFFNARWYEYTGQREDSAEGWGWRSALHPEDLEQALGIWNHSLSTGEDYTVEYRIKSRDGRYRWYQGKAVAQTDESGRVSKWFGTCVDIHDERVKSDVLEEDGKSLRTIIETIPQYIWRTNADGSADYFSEAFCKFVGYPLEQILEWGWAEIIHPEDRDRCLASWQKSRDEQISVSVDFRIFIGQKLEYRWVRSEGNPFFDSSQRLIKYYGTWTDIHDRVHAEAARKASEHRFALMADSAPVLIWIAGVDQKRNWFNKYWLEFTGSQMENSLGDQWLEYIHPEDREAYLTTYNRHYASRNPFQLEYRLKFRDGTYRWINARGVPWFSPEGQFEGFIGACLDIHETKILSESVKNSEVHFRTLVDNSPAILWITDKEARCTYLSQQWYEVTGRTPEQDLGFGWVENCHPDDREAAGKAFFSAIEARGVISIRYRLRQKNGDYRWAIDSGLPLRSDGGEFLGYIGTVIDIHGQIASEEQLKDLQLRFQKSAAATDLGVWYCDLPFDELIWNAEVKSHFFMESDQRVTMDTFYAFMHPDDRDRTRLAIETSIATRSPYDIVYRTVNPVRSGEQNYIRAIGWTDYDAVGNPVRFDGITLNVTDEILRQEELSIAKRAAEAASDAKTKFLANMSHEIRTPLSAIVGFSELLTTSTQSDPTAQSYLNRIVRNSGQLSRLIDELLDLSKIEANKLEVELQTFSIDTLIDDLRSSMGLKAQEKSLTLNFEWTGEKPKLITTDPTRLAQIFNNVVGNAIKFTAQGGVQVELSAQNSLLTVRVSDTGLGLSAEDQKKIFEPFVQADASITRRFGGSGLGLAISKRLCNLLGGDLVIEESKPGRGSTFRFQIPCGSNVDKAGTPDAVKIDTSKSVLGGRKLLVVDDSPDNRALLQVFLGNSGADISEAENGEEAVAMAQANSFDLILMDIQMPVLDGYNAFKKLRALGNKTPTIALTAHAFKEERDRCISAGFDGYLTKPINQLTLTTKILELIAKT